MICKTWLKVYTKNLSILTDFTRAGAITLLTLLMALDTPKK